MLMVRTVLAAAVLACVIGLAGAGEPRTFRSAAYEITTDLPDGVAREVAEHMDAVAVEYARRFSRFGKRNAAPLGLWVFATQQGYMEFLAGHGLNATGTSGVFFRTDDASGLASFLGERPIEVMFETLRHEGLHQVLYQRVGDTVPVWLNEGMAEWFGYALPARRGFAVGLADPRAVRRLQAAERDGRLAPLSELLTMSKQDWNQRVSTGAAGSQYDQAWSVVHFLAHAEGGRYQPLLDALLHAFWQGKSPEQAVASTLGKDLEPMDEAWRAYVRALTPDELYAGRDVLTAYRAVLAALDGAGVRPADAAEMHAALAEHAGRLALPETVPVSGGAVALTLDASAWWRTPPTSVRTGRPAVVRFVPDRRGRLPPSVELRGLRHAVSLTWTRARDGTLTGEIVID